MPKHLQARPISTGERAASPAAFAQHSDVDLPEISHDDTFRDVVKKLSLYIAEVVYMPSTFEQLRTTSAGDDLRYLVDHLNNRVTNPSIVNALLALRWHYGAIYDDRGVSEARANACEIVAWRFLTRLTEREAVEFCLYEIPDADGECDDDHDEENYQPDGPATFDESTCLLGNESGSGSGHGRGNEPGNGTTNGTNKSRSKSRPKHHAVGSTKRYQLLESISRLTFNRDSNTTEDMDNDPTAPFTHLNALEIAAIADAKRFLSQHVVQKIIMGIWNGDIIFWDNLSVRSRKKPRFYKPHTADPYARLRVPKYLKVYEALFFASFLALYYCVLIEQNRYAITVREIMLYIWFAAFFYDEMSEWIDAGSVFYAADVWNLFDMIMLVIGVVYIIIRFIGLCKHDFDLVDLAFDILALEALFMVPRVSSILSLLPYWGTLIPCLKEMGKDFFKFMVLVVIVYLGFLTTFSLIGRAMFSFQHMSLIVTKIFFGANPIGLDIMEDIDPIFGPPLMLIFVTLSSILLKSSLTATLSNSFSRVITHAREEYLYVYSVYVLEASTSNRLTHFYPPFNLLALVIFRPLRLFFESSNWQRQGRILLLRATHAPIVGAIQAYEWLTKQVRSPDGFDTFRGPRRDTSALRRQQIAPPPRHPDSRPRTANAPPRRPTLPDPQPTTASTIGHPQPRPRPVDSYADVSPPSDAEVRIDELAAKIDRLTALVVALQSGAGTETVRT
ncbi:hypothetical protein F4780DRAFT_737071 [Xylariomycetidae sp. FL0641]|nr:hypothetical protein F4780DRAFT_737071 [Xylariomycetidae sp. FL0641]